MAEKDMFAPMTEEEKNPNLFRPMTREEKKLGINPIESAGYGAAQGMTFGFIDEMAAVAAATRNKMAGDTRDFSEVYKEARDVIRDHFKMHEEANPKSYVAGELGGGFLIPGGAAGKGAKGAGKAVTAAAEGVKTIAATAPEIAAGTRALIPAVFQGGKRAASAAAKGAVQAGKELAPVAAAQGAVSGAGYAAEMEDIPRDAITGATIGAGASIGIGAATPAVSKAAGKVGQYVQSKLGEKALRRAAEERAVKAAMGGRDQRALQEVMEMPSRTPGFEKKIHRVGRELLTPQAALEGKAAVTPFSNVVDIAERTKILAEEGGKEIGESLRSLDSVYNQASKKPGAVSGFKIAMRMQDIADEISGPTLQSQRVADRIRKEAESYARSGRMSLADANKIKNSYKWDFKPGAVNEFSDDVNKMLRSAVNEEMEQTVETIGRKIGGTEGLSEKYIQAKERLGALLTAEKMGQKGMAREISNRFFSPTDYATGTATMAGELATGSGGLASMAKAAVAGGIHRQLRTRGASAAAVSLDKLADLVKNRPQALGKFADVLSRAAARGNKSLAVTNYILSQREPEYQKILKDVESTDTVEKYPYLK